jgi:hypothetical protein
MFAAFAVFQVTLTGVSAFNVRHFGNHTVNGAVQTYGFVTGSRDNFAFFASVPNQVRPVFTITTASGAAYTEPLWLDPRNHEAELRLEESTALFGNLPEELRTELLRSWSASVMARHPDAVRCKVRIEAYVIPPLRALWAGTRPQWVQIFSATFEA